MHAFETTWKFSAPCTWSFFGLQEGDGSGAPHSARDMVSEIFLLRELNKTPDGMERVRKKKTEEMDDRMFSSLFEDNLNILENLGFHCITITAQGNP